MSDMEMLFSPCRIGNLVIKNRAVLPPMQVMYGENLGYPGRRAIAPGLILLVWVIDRFSSLLRRKFA